MENNLFEPRRRAIAEGLAERRLDVLLVSLSPNLRYLSGFTGSNGMLLITTERSTLFTDPRYTIQAGQETTCKVRIARGPLVMDVIAAIRKAGLRKIGFEPARMTCDVFESIKSRLPLNTVLVAVRFVPSFSVTVNVYVPARVSVTVVLFAALLAFAPNVTGAGGADAAQV